MVGLDVLAPRRGQKRFFVIHIKVGARETNYLVIVLRLRSM